MSNIENDADSDLDNGNGNAPPRRRLSIDRNKRQNGPAIEERLHKVLANAGLGSRRSLEERIETGEVRVNAQVAELGSSIRAGDRVELDGRAFIAVPTEPEEAQVLLYHKPDGEVTTHDDPEGRPTVFEKLPQLKGARWVSIGRLDINTTGLLLLTTDGELANAMMHPSHEVAREYVCRVHGEVSEEALERLRQGVELEDGPARFDELAVINLGDSHSWFRVVLREGRNREVRRMWESQGLEVSRLKRIRYGSVELPRHLRRGHWDSLDLAAYRELRREVGLSEIAQTLTLQAVIGVRRASAPPKNEFRPTSGKQDAWSSGGQDEARELRAFDFVREDSPRGARPGAKKRRPGGPGGPGGFKKRGPGGPRPIRDAAGDADGNSTANGRRNPAAMRTFSPGGPGARDAGDGQRGAGRGPGARGPGARGPGGPGGRGPGGGPGARGAGRGGPGAGAPGRGGPGAGAPGRGGPGAGARGPGRGGPGGARGGFGQASPGNNAGPGGNRGNNAKRGRGPQAPAMPFGFPSDHAYAKRFETDGNTLGPAKPSGGRRGGPGGGPGGPGGPGGGRGGRNRSRG